MNDQFHYHNVNMLAARLALFLRLIRLVRRTPIVWLATFICLPFTVSCPAAGTQLMQGVVPAAVARLSPIGRLAATEHLNFAIGLPLRNQEELDVLLQQIYDSSGMNYHKFLTTQEFTARFGPTEQDYQSVIEFAESNGLAIAGTYSNRVVLDVDGSVSNIERAFQITLRTYHHPTEPRDFFAPDVEPSVPVNLRMVSIDGLSDFSLPQPATRKVSAAKIRPLSFNGSGPNQEYLGNDFRNAYVPGTTLNGAGQTVALLEYSSYYKVDVTNYENLVGSIMGFTNYVPLTNVVLSGGTPSTANNDEVALDIEMAIAMAPKLSRVIVYEKRSVSSSLLNQIATDDLAKQVSSSWSVGPWSIMTATNYDAILKEMAAQGQSYFQSSGDSDAYTGAQPLDSGTTVPMDSPYATIVGGTTLTMNGTGASWSSETVWNYNLHNPPISNEGSGGGTSSYYPIPSWQANISMANNSGSTANRNIPDVALTADNVFVSYNNGDDSGTYYFMGTSCAAPLWAGFTALVNQQSVAISGTTVGFLNPALYAIANGSNYANCFHDITTGDNIGTNTPGFFSAVAGYDLCTGWGTPSGTNLINALAPSATVVGRWVFYNNSAWDGNNPAANANDDNAIGPDKTALLPGGVATFANYTSYSRGLNGIMVDIANLPGTPTVSDFVFNTGNDSKPAGWSNAPAPLSITVRPGAGTGGSSRVTLIWKDNNLDNVVDANEAVAKHWLEVTALATTNTGLAADDVFFFGNAVGEGNVGNPNTSFPVTSADALQAMNNLVGLGTAALTNINDFNRDQKVTSADALIALNNLSALSSLVKLDLSSSGSSIVAPSTTASAQAGPFLGESLISPGILRLWLWQPQQNNPALEMTDNLVSGKWQPIPSDWLKPLGAGLFEVDVPVGTGSAFLRLLSTGTGAPGQ